MDLQILQKANVLVSKFIPVKLFAQKQNGLHKDQCQVFSKLYPLAFIVRILGSTNLN